MAKILLVEDDPGVVEVVVDALELNNHVVEHVDDGQEAIERLKLYDYDLVVLDWDLPSKSGIEVLRSHRQFGGTLPVLMLTGKDAVANKIEGLDSGADDYLPKPFDMAELMARVRTLLRRPSSHLPDRMEMRGITIDFKTCAVEKDGKEISLLAKEYAVLAFFMRHPGEIFNVDQLLNKVWTSESDSGEDAVRQTISRLRNKIDTDGQPSVISTVKGLGYRLEKN